MNGFAVVALPVLLNGVIAWICLFIVERTKNAARESTDRVLAELKLEHAERLSELQHQFDQRIEDGRHHTTTMLETVRAEHRRRVDEINLYAQKRHHAYPRVYRRYRIALDAWITTSRILDDQSDEFRQLEAGARAALKRAINAEILEDLYFSDAVRQFIHLARGEIARLSAEISHHLRGDPSALTRLQAKEHAAELAVIAVRNAMMTELRTATDVARPSP